MLADPASVQIHEHEASGQREERAEQRTLNLEGDSGSTSAAVNVAMIQIRRHGPGSDHGSTRNRKNIETRTASRIARTTIPSDSMWREK